MKIILVIILCFAIEFCFSQTKSKSNGISQPTMEETARWMMSKYNKSNHENLWGEKLWTKKNDQPEFDKLEGFFSVWITDSISVNADTIKLKAERLHHTKRYSNLFNKYQQEVDWSDTVLITIKCSTIDKVVYTTSEVNRIKIVENNEYAFWLNHGIYLKSSFNSITIQNLRTGAMYNDDEVIIPEIDKIEPGIVERFTKALNYYIKLCKQKYPPKKDLF